MDYAYLVTLGAMIAVIAGTALYTDHLRSQQNVQAAAPAPEVSSSPTPQISPIPVPTLAPIRMPSAAVPFAPSPADRFAASPLSPYSGRVLTAGSRIPLWIWPPKRAKPAVCMRDGVVLSCVRDELWGWSVEIRQTDESVCTYAGLSCVLVQAGQTVARGQALGDVLARIPAESELGPHMHLSLARDGQRVDPASTLPEA